MTTIIATSTELVGDTFVSYSPSFKGDPKIWIAKGCAWDGAGGSAQLSQFRLCTQGSYEEVLANRARLRSESVLATIEQHRAGHRFPLHYF